jgi:succinate--hydroxymethylglutarate CoA-transferase
MCTGIGRPEWIEDANYKTNNARVAHRQELESRIEELTKQKTTQEWLQIYEGKGMPYAAVNDVQATLEHEHTKARNMVVEVQHDKCGPVKLVNTPMKFSETQPTIRSPPPTLGQHTDEVLAELGMSESTITMLKDQGVVR